MIYTAIGKTRKLDLSHLYEQATSLNKQTLNIKYDSISACSIISKDLVSFWRVHMLIMSHLEILEDQSSITVACYGRFGFSQHFSIELLFLIWLLSSLSCDKDEYSNVNIFPGIRC